MYLRSGAVLKAPFLFLLQDLWVVSAFDSLHIINQAFFQQEAVDKKEGVLF